jgi:hypothetical protein
LEGGQLAYGAQGSPCFTLGTEDIQQVQSGLIYPNPAIQNIFWDDQIKSITVFDIQGKMVLQNVQIFNTQSISINDLENGFYTVVIEKGDRRFSQKLVVER